MSEFSTVASEDGPTIGPNGSPTGKVAEGAEDSDRGPMVAVLRGGPAAGKQVLVDRIAGTFPLFIGVDGGNYVRDKGAHDRPVYNWWPAGASAPAGDPRARADTR